MAILKIITKIEENEIAELKEITNVFYFPKEHLGFCKITNDRLLITNKNENNSSFIYYFCNLVNPINEKLNSLALEILNKNIDTEIILDLILNTEIRYYEPGTWIDHTDDYLLRSIICSSENNFHIYIPEHSIKLK